MLSILIPTYNYNITALVTELHAQATAEGIPFEIIVIDDCSSDNSIVSLNNEITTLSHTFYEILNQNIGRSNIRNLLSKKATYPWMLFLDADTAPTNKTFVAKFVAASKLESQVVFGGIHYKKNEAPENSLRYKFGIKRESTSHLERIKSPYLSFITMAFLVHKDVFNKVRFSENLLEYGYEDVVFALHLRKNNIEILHIDNTITHLNLETNLEFVNKYKKSLQSLLNFNAANEIKNNDISLLKIYHNLKTMHLTKLIAWCFSLLEKSIMNQLASKKPSLLVFDIFKLGYLCSLNHAKNA